MSHEEEILATLKSLLENQQQSLAIQRQAVEQQQTALANQQRSLRSQLSTNRLYRIALSVLALLLAGLGWFFLSAGH